MDHILLLIMGAAALSVGLSVLLKRLSMPPVIAHMMTGLLIGELYGLRQDQTSLLQSVSEFGIVFLMFTIGLEFSPRQLRAMARQALALGGTQMALTSGVIAAILVFGLDIGGWEAAVIGAGAALSSTAIVLRELNDNGDLNKPYGRQTIGVLLFQDLSMIPLLLMVGLAARQEQAVALVAAETVLAALAALAVIYLTGKFVLGRALDAVSDLRRSEIFLAMVLLIAVSAAWLTHALGFSYSLGAFLAGLMLAETRYKHQIEAEMQPFRDLLLATFFIVVGMQVNIGFAWEHLGLIVVASIALMALKTVMTTLAAWRHGDHHDALKTGLALCQGGGFSFALFEAARAAGLLSEELFQWVISCLALTMLLTPRILEWVHQDGGGLLSRSRGADLGPDPARLISSDHNHVVLCGVDRAETVHLEKGHIIVCGYGAVGREAMRLLGELGHPAVAIDHQRSAVEEGAMRGDAVMFGNAANPNVLERAWARDAAAVLITLGDRRGKRLIGEAVSRLCQDPVIVVTAADGDEQQLLSGLPIKHLVRHNEEAARLLIDHALTCEVRQPYTPRICRECDDPGVKQSDCAAPLTPLSASERVDG
ncbi:cation:proton antiporter [Magnetofaba australis]|nr:cation:proton antiporter [Magnetofaba australis]